MRLGKKSKIFIFVILTVSGIIFVGYGAEKVIFPEPLEMELNVDEIINLKVPLERNSKVYPNMSLKSEDGTDIPAVIRTLKLDLESEYVFAANHPIHFVSEAILREPKSVKEMYLIFNNPDTEPPKTIPDLEGFIKYHESLKGIIPFHEKDFLTFELEDTRPFPTELDLTLYVVIKKINDDIEILPLNNNEPILHIGSSAEKLQIDTNRFTLAELVVSNEALKKQHRNNQVMEGLSFIVLGFIFLEPAYRIYNSIGSSDTHSK